MILDELKIIKASGKIGSNKLVKLKSIKNNKVEVYPKSITTHSDLTFFIGTIDFEKYLNWLPLQGCCRHSYRYLERGSQSGLMGNRSSHHPIGAAVANAVLGVLRSEFLVDTAGPKGGYLREQLSERVGGHPNVGDIRGLGLLNAIEFVADRGTKEPYGRSETVAERVTQACFERGLTVYPCGSAVDGNVGDAVLLGPPLSVTTGELDAMVERLAAAVTATLPQG